jgi:apolipoprotein N-acyltransferase
MVAALVGGALTSLAFAPAAWWPFVLVGPAIGLWSAAVAGTVQRGALCGLVYGLAFAFTALHWMLALDPLAGIVLPLVQAVFWAIPGGVAAAAARLRPGWWVTAVAASWILAEAARGRVPLTGFEWGQLSMATVDLPVRSAPAVVGALGTTGLLIGIAAALAVLVIHGRTWQPVVATLAIIAVVAGLGAVRWTSPDGQLTVAVVQVDDPCPGAFAADCPGYIDRLTQAYIDGTAELGADPDIVVWGEDALPGAVTRRTAGTELIANAGTLRAPVLAGVGTPTTPGRFLRWAALFDTDGTALDGYAKRMPVPFGEYVPLRDVLGGISDVGRLVPADLEAGDDTSPVVLRTDSTIARLGTVVSWEVTFARAVRDVARDANALATLTTVASYGRSAASDQLVAIGQLRAAEHQKSMFMAATTGRSALIDPVGRTTAVSALFEADELTGVVPLRSGLTPYAVVGDAGIMLLAGVALTVVWVASRRSSRVTTPSHAAQAAASQDHQADPVTR